MASHRSVGWFFQPSLQSNDIVDECIDIYHNRFTYNLRNTNQMFVVILLKGYIQYKLCCFYRTDPLKQNRYEKLNIYVMYIFIYSTSSYFVVTQVTLWV